MWQFVLPYMFNVDEANMGSSINFIFAGCCFVSIFGYFFYLPETANRSFEKIDEMYLNNVPPRKFKSYESKENYEAKAIKEEKGENVQHVDHV